jgi:hypothetical protein
MLVTECGIYDIDSCYSWALSALVTLSDDDTV